MNKFFSLTKNRFVVNSKLKTSWMTKIPVIVTVVLGYFGGFLCTLGTWVGYIPFSGYIFLPTCHPGDYLSTVHLLINICGYWLS